jgi:hypothetical protein
MACLAQSRRKKPRLGTCRPLPRPPAR